MSNVFSLPFGPGIIGYNPQYDVADPWVDEGVTVGMPYLDQQTRRLLYRNVGYSFLHDEATGGSALDFASIDAAWRAWKKDWEFNAIVDSQLTQTAGYLGGQPFEFVSPGVIGVQIDITQQSPQVNEWFPQSNVGKWGWFTYGVGGSIGPVQWINQPNQSFSWLDSPHAPGFRIYLFKGCAANISMYFRKNTPRLTLTVGGGTADYPSGTTDGDYPGGSYIAYPVGQSLVPTG